MWQISNGYSKFADQLENYLLRFNREEKSNFINSNSIKCFSKLSYFNMDFDFYFLLNKISSKSKENSRIDTIFGAHFQENRNRPQE